MNEENNSDGSFEALELRFLIWNFVPDILIWNFAPDTPKYPRVHRAI